MRRCVGRPGSKSKTFPPLIKLIMITLIIITAYIANVFLCRRLTRLAVKNQGKYMTVSYDYPIVWFIPILGNMWCTLDYISSSNRNKFFGKNW